MNGGSSYILNEQIAFSLFEFEIHVQKIGTEENLWRLELSLS